MTLKLPMPDAIDCDLHPAVPTTKVLLPFFDDYWRDAIVSRGIDRLNLDITAYPPGAPLSGRSDWRPKQGSPGSDIELMRRQALDGFGTRLAILNCLHAAQIFHSEDMGAAFCRAINDWLAAEWLDREPRFRASIVIPTQSIELAVEEIERRAPDGRFVQVLMLAGDEMPLGRRHYWPIYRAAERHGLPIGIHAGSTYRHAPTPGGWPSYYLEDYVSYAGAFESTLLSLVSEGVFVKFPKLKAVFIESGFTWLPACLWRFEKTWRGVRSEIPWVDRPPSEIVREHIRFTLQPIDEPPHPGQLELVLEQMGSDALLLFSTDYPHWQFDGDAVLPPGLPDALVRKILIDNPLSTYPRLGATVSSPLKERTP
jgi:predicted TIM-barrel fold metal-dependent hydrolase